MQCSKCGREIPQGTTFCPGCGAQVFVAQQAPGAPMTPVKNWLVPAILATIFCCLPFGIVSIIFASRANSEASAGNYQQAQINADKAKTWFWIAFGVGIVVQIISGIVQIVAAVAANS